MRLWLLLLAASVLPLAVTAIGGIDFDSQVWQRIFQGIRDGLHWPFQFFADPARKGRPPKDHVKVVMAGLPRTGTTSFYHAMKELGFTPLHDDTFHEMGDKVKDLFDENKPEITQKEHLEQIAARGFDAIFWFDYDLIAAAVARDDVKVILTVRDDPRKWAHSWQVIGIVPDILFSPPFIWAESMKNIIPSMEKCFRRIPTGGKPEEWRDIDVLVQGYHKHIRTVKEMVPPERLLIFNVKQGWEPLCNFLELPVPPDDKPFPHINDRVVIQAFVTTMWIVTWIWPVFPVLALIFVYWMLKCCCMFRSGRRRSPLRAPATNGAKEKAS